MSHIPPKPLISVTSGAIGAIGRCHACGKRMPVVAKMLKWIGSTSRADNSCPGSRETGSQFAHWIATRQPGSGVDAAPVAGRGSLGCKDVRIFPLVRLGEAEVVFENPHQTSRNGSSMSFEAERYSLVGSKVCKEIPLRVIEFPMTRVSCDAQLNETVE